MILSLLFFESNIMKRILFYIAMSTVWSLDTCVCMNDNKNPVHDAQLACAIVDRYIDSVTDTYRSQQKIWGERFVPDCKIDVADGVVVQNALSYVFECVPKIVNYIEGFTAKRGLPPMTTKYDTSELNGIADYFRDNVQNISGNMEMCGLFAGHVVDFCNMYDMSCFACNPISDSRTKKRKRITAFIENMNEADNIFKNCLQRTKEKFPNYDKNLEAKLLRMSSVLHNMFVDEYKARMKDCSPCAANRTMYLQTVVSKHVDKIDCDYELNIKIGKDLTRLGYYVDMSEDVVPDALFDVLTSSKILQMLVSIDEKDRSISKMVAHMEKENRWSLYTTQDGFWELKGLADYFRNNVQNINGNMEMCGVFARFLLKISERTDMFCKQYKTIDDREEKEKELNCFVCDIGLADSELICYLGNLVSMVRGWDNELEQKLRRMSSVLCDVLAYGYKSSFLDEKLFLDFDGDEPWSCYWDWLKV